MPQMSPMDWFMLFSYFLFIYYLILLLVYFKIKIMKDKLMLFNLNKEKFLYIW